MVSDEIIRQAIVINADILTAQPKPRLVISL